jgi:hypothetical protein
LELNARRLVNEAGERAANVAARANAEVLEALAVACVKELIERTAVLEAMAKD